MSEYHFYIQECDEGEYTVFQGSYPKDFKPAKSFVNYWIVLTTADVIQKNPPPTGTITKQELAAWINGFKQSAATLIAKEFTSESLDIQNPN